MCVLQYSGMYVRKVDKKLLVCACYDNAEKLKRPLRRPELSLCVLKTAASLSLR